VNRFIILVVLLLTLAVVYSEQPETGMWIYVGIYAAFMAVLLRKERGGEKMEKEIAAGAVVIGIIVWWKRVVSFVTKAIEIWTFWSPIIGQIVAQLEQDAKDGKITKDERKATAMKAIDLISEARAKPLGKIQKMVISWIVDYAARKLIPHDIVIEKVVAEARNDKA
jgi:hypothetical protein